MKLTNICVWRQCGFMLLSLTCWTACTSFDPDLQAPTLTLVQPNALDTSYYHSADTLVWQAILSDDQSLDQYQIDIKPVATNPDAWILSELNPLIGNQAQVTRQIAIPLATQTGMYYLQSYCTDAANHHSDTTTTLLRLQNATDTLAPQIAILLPTDTVLTVFSSSNIILLCHLTDDQALHSYYLQLYKNGASAPIYQSLPTAINATSYEWQEVVPAPAQNGNYSLYLHLRDAVNNSTQRQISLTVL